MRGRQRDAGRTAARVAARAWFALGLLALLAPGLGAARDSGKATAFPGPLLPFVDAVSLTAAMAPADASPADPRAAAAPAVEIAGSLRFWRRGADDVLHFVRAPARWERAQWQRFGLGLAAVGLSIAVFDEPLRDAVSPRADRNSLLDRADRLGERKSTHLLMAGFYGYGWLQDDERAKAVAVDSFFATVIAGGLVTSKLKRAFGRDRPYLGGDAHRFDAFGGRSQDQRAFPSGHSTEAFAVAGVIATHYADSPAVVWSAYSLAALTGLSRMKKDQHWASDVLAGAMIGGGIGRMVARHNTAQRAAGLSLVLGDEGPMLAYSHTWR
jgi:membrane-associated phospholipid phosphatase